MDDRDKLYEDLLKKKTLTPAERVTVLEVEIDYGEQALSEIEGEFMAERSMFGDGPPGSQITINEIRKGLRLQRDALARAKAIAANQGVRA